MVTHEDWDAGEGTMTEMVELFRSTTTAEIAGVVGKLVGVGLLAALVYGYCNVLVEACVRAVT